LNILRKRTIDGLASSSRRAMERSSSGIQSNLTKSAFSIMSLTERTARLTAPVGDNLTIQIQLENGDDKGLATQVEILATSIVTRLSHLSVRGFR
jgi:hypothetical protein